MRLYRFVVVKHQFFVAEVARLSKFSRVGTAASFSAACAAHHLPRKTQNAENRMVKTMVGDKLAEARFYPPYHQRRERFSLAN